MRDISIPYDAVCVVATADYLNRNITIITTKLTWEYDGEEMSDIVVVMCAPNNIWASTEGW